jgi:hypothetical protein
MVMAMEWNSKAEKRLTELRLKELSGTLTSNEQTELDEMITALDLEESNTLAENTSRWLKEESLIRAKLQVLQDDNEDLARLLAQQEKLAADARHWRKEFEYRHESIQDSYRRLVGEASD